MDKLELDVKIVFIYLFIYFTKSVVKYWNRSREVLKSPFMEMFKALLEMALSNLL